MNDEMRVWRNEIEQSRKETDRICKESREMKVQLEQTVTRLAKQVDECVQDTKALHKSFDALEKEILKNHIQQ